MSLQRKVGSKGDSLTIVIPAQLADFHEISEGSLLEFQPMNRGIMKLVAMGQLCKIRKKGTTEIKTFRTIEQRCKAPSGWEVIE